jgi:hypothetical protein
MSHGLISAVQALIQHLHRHNASGTSAQSSETPIMLPPPGMPFNAAGPPSMDNLNLPGLEGARDPPSLSQQPTVSTLANSRITQLGKYGYTVEPSSNPNIHFVSHPANEGGLTHPWDLSKGSPWGEAQQYWNYKEWGPPKPEYSLNFTYYTDPKTGMPIASGIPGNVPKREKSPATNTSVNSTFTPETGP